MTQIDSDALAISRVRGQLADGTARRIREAARLDQADIARALGVSRAAVESWEAGRRSPRPDVAIRLAAILHALQHPGG